MDAKDFLKMNEQMIAFNVLMKGDLAKEVEAAKAAIDALGGAQAIAGLQAQLEADQVKFEDYKMSIQAGLDAQTQKLEAAAMVIHDEQVKLAADQQAVMQASKDLDAAKEEFLVAQAEAKSALEEAQKELDSRSQLVEADRITLDKEFAGIAARELAVSQKLAAMKAIV